MPLVYHNIGECQGIVGIILSQVDVSGCKQRSYVGGPGRRPKPLRAQDLDGGGAEIRTQVQEDARWALQPVDTSLTPITVFYKVTAFLG